MYGKRFVTGDRQKACLFEQKGSYMAKGRPVYRGT